MITEETFNKDQLFELINDMLNKALIGKDKIKQPNTNKIGEFALDYIKDNYPSVGSTVKNKQVTELLPVVVQQRELLIAYSKMLGLAEYEHTQELVNDDIDDFLSNL